MTTDESVFTNVYMAHPPKAVKVARIEYREAHLAVQAAEEWLAMFGTRGVSRVDVFLNGDRHSTVVRLPEERYAIFNEPDAEFPVSYVEEDGRDLHPSEFDVFKLDSEPDGGEEEESGESENDGDGESETESEVPRVRLFARIKGNGYTRKRFESDARRTRNRFQVFIGRLPEWYQEGERQSQRQERDLLASVEFTEDDNNREAGMLRVRFPKRFGSSEEELPTLNMEMTDPGRGVFVFDVPLQRKDA